MRRGDIWTASGGNDYAGKPRPVVIVQDDSFDSTASITICAFTTDETDAPLIRLLIEPNGHNGLRLASRLMVDKITTVPKSKLGKRIGRLDDQDIVRLNQAILVFSRTGCVATREAHVMRTLCRALTISEPKRIRRLMFLMATPATRDQAHPRSHPG